MAPWDYQHRGKKGQPTKEELRCFGWAHRTGYWVGGGAYALEHCPSPSHLALPTHPDAALMLHWKHGMFTVGLAGWVL